LAESNGLYEVRSVPTVLGKINVRTIGRGPAMVCWPSLLMSGAMWRGQVDRFGPAHRMVLIDPPGHGGSEPLQRTFTLVECAVCLAQVLDDLAIDACILMGNSWGGMMGGGVCRAVSSENTRCSVDELHCIGAGRPSTAGVLRARITAPSLNERSSAAYQSGGKGVCWRDHRTH